MERVARAAGDKRRRSPLPSVYAMMQHELLGQAVVRFGRQASLSAVRRTLELLRADIREGNRVSAAGEEVAAIAWQHLERDSAPSVRTVFNLTGTVLHTNLGRAILAEPAVEAAAAAMRRPVALEFDIGEGKRGERDDHVRGLICELTGAEDACVVNNNAAAVLLLLNTLAMGRETIMSRGELIEIGGAFRMPDIMARAGTTLVEIGTTNRTHLRDYEAAIGPGTALLMKVHTSNYLIQGFTKSVSTAALKPLAEKHGLPLVDDLGSGTLVDLAAYGLRPEPTVQAALAAGADLVSFSGDKLLGGPQCGIVAGRRDLVRRISKNPIKRAVRLDKVRLAALEATLRLYRNPDRLAEALPTLRYFTRPKADMAAQAQRLAGPLAQALGADYTVRVAECASQIGSGALPLEVLASAGLAIAASDGSSGRRLEALQAALRGLPVPVIGRIEDAAVLLDLRCLDDEVGFLAQFPALEVRDAAG